MISTLEFYWEGRKASKRKLRKDLYVAGSVREGSDDLTKGERNLNLIQGAVV